MLAEGPSNGSMMALQMTLFGTVVEKGWFFKGLPSPACWVLCRCWSVLDVELPLIVRVINNFLPTKRGMGVGLGNFEKLMDRKTITICRRPLTFLIHFVQLHNKVSKGCVGALHYLWLVSFLFVTVLITLSFGVNLFHYLYIHVYWRSIYILSSAYRKSLNKSWGRLFP